MSYLRKKNFRGSNKSNRCFMCNKKGHFAKNYLNKVQAVKLVNYLVKKVGCDPNQKDVESVFSLKEEPIPKTLLALKVDDSSNDEAQSFYKVSPVIQFH